jgi:outer membrane protein assembly factor BamE (lipoprotein component of BamABCDE complex)
MSKLALSHVVFFSLLLLGACQTAKEHTQDVQSANETEERIIVETVQLEIKIGMSGAEVIKAFGSPSIITTDEQRREAWIYDKISTNRIYSERSSGATILFIGDSDKAGSSSTSQKTLTVIIKLDEDKKVRDFAYHTSRF